ncbi:site-specific recombinase xerd [Haloferax sp. BAB-2207]|nr:site-specific recombinase xerd [Haloferax sp. BAB-2207]
MSDSTKESYADAVSRFEQTLDNTSLSEVSDFQLEKYIKDMHNEDYSSGHITKEYYALRKFYDTMYDRDVMADLEISKWKNVKSGTKRSQVGGEHGIYALEPEEVQKLIDNVPTPTLRNELMIRLAYQTGLRRSEIVNIKLRDIDTDKRSIHIPAIKSKEPRTVYYQPTLQTTLRIWIESDRNAVFMAEDSPYLFPTTESEKMFEGTYADMVRETAKEAGIQEELFTDNAGNTRNKVTSHTLRHTYAVQAVKNGMGIRMLQELMGHESIEITEVYLKIAGEHVKNAAYEHGPSLQS